MLFLDTRLGDITVEDIAGMIPFFLIGCVVICVISALIIKKKDSENNVLPIRSMNAKIVDKDQPAPNAVTLVGWILFETEDGNRVRVSCKESGNYVIGDQGYLTWRGSRMISFERGKTKPASGVQTNGASAYGSAPMPQNKIPAWKQVELESKEEQ